MQVRDKVVVVTGAASGIGAALAARFAAEGAGATIVIDIDGEGAEKVADRIDGFLLKGHECGGLGYLVEASRRQGRNRDGGYR